MNEDIKGFKCNCPIELLSLEEWLKKESPHGNCKPCLLTPLTQWYVSELEERGETKEANTIREITQAKNTTPELLAKELDAIKKRSNEDLKERLKDLDCEIQVNDADGKI